MSKKKDKLRAIKVEALLNKLKIAQDDPIKYLLLKLEIINLMRRDK